MLFRSDALRDVWALCQRRLAMAADREGVAWATVFKNSGARAGASLEHVHSQIVGLDVVPPAIRVETAGIRRDPDTFSRLIETARVAGRIIAERDGVVMLVPPAPRQPFETWLITAFPEAHVHTLSTSRVAAVADLTQDLIRRLERVAPGCHYNWWLHQAPFTSVGSSATGIENWHWHLEIVPRLSPFAGFELGTGCHITTMSPAESARRLREA